MNLKQENAALQKKILDLESKLNCSSSDVLQEMEARRIKEKNVIMLGVEETAHTTNQITEILNVITLGYHKFDTSFRLGRPNSERPRPLKVVFQNPSEALRVLKSKGKIPRDKYPNLQIKNDKTPLQTKQSKEVYEEVTRRKNSGENVSMRFVNNTPIIVVNNNKRARVHSTSPELNMAKTSKKDLTLHTQSPS